MRNNKIIIQLLLVLGIFTLSAQAYSICGDGALEDQEALYGVQGGGGGGGGGVPSDLLILDPNTGAILQNIGSVGFTMTGLAVHPQTGVLYGVTGGADPTNPGHLISIDWVTGAGTLIGDMILGSDVAAADISFTSDATLYGWSEDGDDLITIDLTTGLGTIIAESGLNTFGSGLAALNNATLYLVGDGEDSVLSFIDIATGQEDAIQVLNGGLGNDNPINALAFNEDGELYGVRNDQNNMTPNDLIIIDITTGNITTVGPSDNRLDGIVFYNPQEVCDDGNTTDGDGCSAACDEVEEGYNCDTPGAPCELTETCGDGQLTGAEVCDDSNTVDGDGCSADCSNIESDFTCPVVGEACEPIGQVTPGVGEVNGGGCSLQSSAAKTQYFSMLSLGLLLGLGIWYRLRRS